MMSAISHDTAMPLSSDIDVLKARQCGKELAASLRFSTSELTIIATAISEIARNTVLYAKDGWMELRVIQKGNRRGLLVIAEDGGPGITDLSLAMQDGYTTSRGLGIGLPGAKRLMDEFEIASEVGKGTTIIMKKWER
ncbi:anti-sigma regulatory factor [Noviherbaspirillum autotrophicum]|jgi:serine/threonine-protein kinase RsbT|nr:anti-sigma regulatory factor [Noviherbaspirillum autotrophicum]